MRHLLAAVVLGLGVVAAASSANADLPPPDGQKFVDYAFKVDGLASFGGYVLLAYPYSLSNGRPTTEHAKLEDGKPTSLGRRSPQPKLYAMKKQAYEQWLQSYKPAEGEMEDPALDALFKSDKVVACDAKLSPSFQLAKEDPRSVVVEAFRAKSIDDKTCQLELAGAPPSSDTPTSSPPTKLSNTETPSTTPAPATKGGCAGCATVPADDDPSALALLALLAIGATRLRRRAFAAD
jgi:MYXO-CTERM domain-containing protein